MIGSVFLLIVAKIEKKDVVALAILIVFWVAQIVFDYRF